MSLNSSYNNAINRMLTNFMQVIFETRKWNEYIPWPEHLLVSTAISVQLGIG